MAAIAAAGWGGIDEEREICNDNGFVYKRRKRRPEDDAGSSSIAATAPPPDPKTELRFRRARKKIFLMSLREKYLREIQQWERLDAALHDFVRATEKTSKTHAATATATASTDASSRELASHDTAVRPLIEELLLQVEAQETILGKLSSLCDILESECDADEESLMLSLVDLPVWANPRALVVALSD